MGGPLRTVSCELSIVLTSRKIELWSFLGRQGVTDLIQCEFPYLSICERSWRSCANVSLGPGALCARGLTRLLCDPDRNVHTFSESGRVHTVCLYFSPGVSTELGRLLEVHARMARSEYCSIRGGPFLPRPSLGSILCVLYVLRLTCSPIARDFKAELQLLHKGR